MTTLWTPPGACAAFGDRPLAIDDGGGVLDRPGLDGLSKLFERHVAPRSLVLVLARNTVAALGGLLVCLQHGIVPLLLGASANRSFILRWIDRYHPTHLWLPADLAIEFTGQCLFSAMDFCLIRSRGKEAEVHRDLSLLLPTSGSTGSPKLVRHSYANLSSSARNVARIFTLAPGDRPIAALPLHFTMGLSVAISHLHVGATVLLARSSVADARFWAFVKEARATSFTGVPYSFEMLHRLGFPRMDLPHLRDLSQGGGKLRAPLFQAFAAHAQKTGRRFFATYGQTEGTGRMAFLPYDQAFHRIGSIGQALPEGVLTLIDDRGEEQTEPTADGELIYRGPNVTLGYANEKADLRKGDEFGGVLHTGDLARRDPDGFYYITGRRHRFLKLYGIRVGLDEIEGIVKDRFPVECRAEGDDSALRIAIDAPGLTDAVRTEILEKTGLFHAAVKVEHLASLTRNEAGKVISEPIQGSS